MDVDDDDYDYEYAGYEYFKLAEDAKFMNYVPTWKMHLYYLQLEAPKPKPIGCEYKVLHRPAYYDEEFHGCISREETERILGRSEDGSFLIRLSDSGDGQYRLAIRFQGQSRHFKLFYDGQFHFVGEKRFDTMRDLVADGLITMYINSKADNYLDEMQKASVYTDSMYYKCARDRGDYSDIIRRTIQKARHIKAIARAMNVCSTDEQSDSSPDGLDDIDGTLSDSYDKAHKFKIHTWRGPHWCDFCANFLWGVVQQGVKCADCGFKAHVKCALLVPDDCTPSMKYVKKVFGIDLTTLCKAQGTAVPGILKKCLEEIEARGLETEGIYRLSGEQKEVEAMRKACDKNRKGLKSKNVDEEDDVHTLASLIKLFLRLLPIPLVTFGVYQKVIKASEEKTLRPRLRKLREAISLLPQAHYQTLKYFLGHLARVAQKQSANRMSVENLAKVFSPTVLRSPFESSDPMAALANVEIDHRAVTYLIVYQRVLFK